MTSEKNRLQKVLEDANIKLGSVVSNIDGKSSKRMIQSLLEKMSFPEKKSPRWLTAN
jgi:transposase